MIQLNSFVYITEFKLSPSVGSAINASRGSTKRIDATAIVGRDRSNFPRKLVTKLNLYPGKSFEDQKMFSTFDYFDVHTSPEIR